MSEEGKTIQIDADAKAMVIIKKNDEVVETVESSRHASVLYPLVEELVAKHRDPGFDEAFKAIEEEGTKLLQAEDNAATKVQLDALEAKLKDLDNVLVEVKIEGVNAKDGQKTEWVLLEAPSSAALPVLQSRSIDKEQAMVAAQSFFGDMLDIAKVKTLAVVVVFEEGQSSFVMTNKSLEHEPGDLFRLMSTTAMQMDRLQKDMVESGVMPPEAEKNAILTPKDAGFQNTMHGVNKGIVVK